MISPRCSSACRGLLRVIPFLTIAPHGSIMLGGSPRARPVSHTHSAYNSCFSLNFFIDEPQQADSRPCDDAQLPQKVQPPKKADASPFQTVSPVADSAAWKGYSHQHSKCQRHDASYFALFSSRLKPAAVVAATLLRGFSIIKGRHKTKGFISYHPQSTLFLQPPPLNRFQGQKAASRFLRTR